MQLYRFSPIKNEERLRKALEYTHIACHQLCKQNLGKLLPVSGNIGIFCHYEEEFERLTALRKELTDENNNWRQKYYHLHEPLTFVSKDGIPETTYTYLYIRRTDPYRGQVGDADFVMNEQEFNDLKAKLAAGEIIKGVRYRDDLGLIELFDPDIDGLAYVGAKAITEEIEEEKR